MVSKDDLLAEIPMAIIFLRTVLILFSLSSFILVSQPLFSQGNHSSATLLAQQGENDDQDELIIEEGSQGDSSDSFIDFWNKYFKFGIGTSSGYYVNTDFEENGYRLYHFAFLNFDYAPFEWISIKMAGEVYRSDIVLALTAGDDNTQRPADGESEPGPDDEESSSMRYEKGEWVPIIRDTYLQLDITQYARLSIGRKTIVWGQLNAISPVDIVLPIRVQSQALAFNKAGNRIPQDVAILGLYPTENIEMEGYYFPKTTLDRSTVNVLEDFTDDENVSIDLHNTFDDLDQNYQVAGRLIFYLDFMTLGFSYFNGFYTFGTIENARWLSSVENTSFDRDNNPRITIEHDYRIAPSLYRAQTLGLELSIPVQEWALKIESAFSTRKTEIDSGSINLVFSDQAQRQQQVALIDWVRNENNGSLTVDHYEVISGIGLDADLDRWVFNLLVLNVTNIYPDHAQEGLDLVRELEEAQGDSTGLETPLIIPFFNIGWYASADKKTTLGLLGGFLGPIGFGASIYITQTLFDDDFRWAISLDGISFHSDNFVEVTGGAEPRDSFLFGVKIILTYTI